MLRRAYTKKRELVTIPSLRSLKKKRAIGSVTIRVTHRPGITVLPCIQERERISHDPSHPSVWQKSSAVHPRRGGRSVMIRVIYCRDPSYLHRASERERINHDPSHPSAHKNDFAVHPKKREHQSRSESPIGPRENCSAMHPRKREI